VLQWEAMSFIKTHPFWALLVAGLVLAVLSFVLFVPGHGSGGMDLGPITPDRSGKYVRHSLSVRPRRRQRLDPPGLPGNGFTPRHELRRWPRVHESADVPGG
jgi:hypothetical protein